jgi:hypothetical protein
MTLLVRDEGISTIIVEQNLAPTAALNSYVWKNPA